VEFRDPSMLDGCSAAQAQRSLLGARVLDIERRGKYLVLRTDRERHVLFHLGMSGRYELDHSTETAPHTRVVFFFDGGQRLAYVNQRRFGTIKLARDPEAVRSIRELGPDPLDEALDVATFTRMLVARKRPLKPLLVDQSFVAGIGNLFADEILFQAGLRPDQRASDMTPPQAAALHAAMRSVLAEAIKRLVDGEPYPKDWLCSQRSDEADCPRCGFPLIRTSFAKRAATFCRRCQK